MLYDSYILDTYRYNVGCTHLCKIVLLVVKQERRNMVDPFECTAVSAVAIHTHQCDRGFVLVE